MGAADKPIPNPSTYLYSLPLNKKKELVTGNSRKVLKRFLVKPKKVEDGLLNNSSKIILIVSVSGTFVNKLLTSYEAMNKLCALGKL